MSPVESGLAHLHSGTLVGRERELRQLEGSLKQAASSNGTFVLISGEQGVGKTALLQHLKTDCQFRGIVFVDSHCLENQTVAYQPLMEALRKLKPYVESRCPGRILARMEEVLNWSGEDSSAYPEDQTSLHLRITELLVDISRFLHFAMVIENLQWADSSTLQFLTHFQSQKERGRILLCGSLREEESRQDGPLQKLLESCPKENEDQRLIVKRLDPSSTRELIFSKFVRSEFPSPFFTWVHERTAGNPFFIIQVLKYLLEKEMVVPRDSFWKADIEKLEESEIPDSVEAVLLANLGRYDQSTLDFLSAAAVIGKRFSLGLLGQLEPTAEGALSEIATSLTRDQVLSREEESGGGKGYYQFANQSLQNLLYQRVDRTKRIGLHYKVAQLLEKVSGEEEESVFNIAFHYLQGRDFDKAYQYAILSAEKMKQRFANDEVLRYLKRAIEVAPKVPDKEEALRRQIGALQKRARFCREVGDLNQAEKDYRTILQLARDSGDLQILAETYNGLGETYRLKHDYKRGISSLERAMQIHRKLNDPLELARTLSYMGLLYWTDSQFENALDSFHRALEIDQKLGDRSYMASTLNNMGLVYWSRRGYHEALRRFKDCLSLYEELDNKEWIARSHNNIGATLFELGGYGECIEHFQKSLRINQKIGNHKEVAFNLENLSEAYRKVGDFRPALQHAAKGLKLASDIDSFERKGRILKSLGAVHLELGEYQKADRYFQQARDVAERIEDKELKILALLGSGRLRAVLNDPQGANRLLEEASTVIDEIGDEKSLISLHQIRSTLHRKEGRFEQARSLLEEAVKLAEKLNLGEEMFSLKLKQAELYLDLGEVLRCKQFLDRARNSGPERYALLRPEFYLISGKAEQTEGDLKSAQKDFETALESADKLDSPEARWQAQHSLGRLHLCRHDVESAYKHLKAAGTTLRRLSQNVEDEKLRQTYLGDPRKRELLSDLQEAAKELVGEARVK